MTLIAKIQESTFKYLENKNYWSTTALFILDSVIGFEIALFVFHLFILLY